MRIRTAILTISDRSYRGERSDESGPALAKAAGNLGWEIIVTGIAPDEKELIQLTLMNWSDTGDVDIILTTGGTGFAPRDVTPEATLAVIERQAFGLTEVMRAASMKITPHAMLSRAVAGIRRKTLIINMPGSQKAALENLASISSVLPHAVELLQESPTAEKGHQPP